MRDNSMEDKAVESIILNPYYNGKHGEEKVTDGFEEWSSEKVMKPNEIYPGQIYTFIYNAKNPSVYETPDGPIEFFDKLPVVLVTTATKNVIQGINLNMCTRELRAIILNLIWNMDPKFFEQEAKEKGQRGERPISNQLINKVGSPGFAVELFKFLNMLAPADYRIIFRTYSVSAIRKINMLEIWQW